MGTRTKLPHALSGAGQTTCPQLPPPPGYRKEEPGGAHPAHKMFCVFAWSDPGQTTTTPSSMLGVPRWPGFPCTDPVPTQSPRSNRLPTEAWPAASLPGASESDSCFPQGLKSLLLVDSQRVPCSWTLHGPRGGVMG